MDVVDDVDGSCITQANSDHVHLFPLIPLVHNTKWIVIPPTAKDAQAGGLRIGPAWTIAVQCLGTTGEPVDTNTCNLAIQWLLGDVDNLSSSMLNAWLTPAVTTEASRKFGYTVVGLDSETGHSKFATDLIQLAVRGRILLIHRLSGQFGQVKELLENRWTPLSRFGNSPIRNLCIFSGAELAGDALGLLLAEQPRATIGNMAVPSMRLSAGLDLTPLHTENESRNPKGLMRMFNDVFSCEWHKDKAVTCSNWSVTPLSPAQIKYAALDAWASEAMGLHALAKHRNRYNDPESLQTSGLLFSCHAIPRTIATLLGQILSWGQALSDAQKSTHTVAVGNVVVDLSRGPNVTRLACMVFNKRLRARASVEASVLGGQWSTYSIASPEIVRLNNGGNQGGQGQGRPQAQGVKHVLQGVVKEVQGQLAYIEWRRTRSDSAASVAKAVEKAFRDHWLTITSNNYGELDLPIMETSSAVKALVRAHHPVTWSCDGTDGHLPSREFSLTRALDAVQDAKDDSQEEDEKEDGEYPPIPVRNLLRGSGLGLALRLLGRGTPFTNLRRPVGRSDSDSVFHNNETFKLPLELERSFDKHCALLNTSQKTAVLRALTHRVSAIRGPPGTGKTSTLAALAGTMVNGGKRVLVLAPANAATMRALESIIAAGHTSVALLVSKDFLFDWHQDSYHAHLQPFVVTPEVVDRKSSKANGRQFRGVNSDVEHAVGDLGDRIAKKPPSKWDSVIKSFGARTEVGNHEKPHIIIVTYGSLISNDGEGAKKAGGRGPASWSEIVSALVDWSRISTVVVDETSQLWEGHALALFRRFTPQANIVLVGDDRQLPPYGTDAVPGAKSLFDSAILCHPCVPATMLDISYRLPSPVASILSHALYDRALCSARNPRRDAVVRARIASGLRLGGSELDPMSIDALNLSLIGNDSKALPILWVHVSGKKYTPTKTGGSSGNIAEQRIVSVLAADLLHSVRLAENAEGIQGSYNSSTNEWIGYNGPPLDRDVSYPENDEENDSECEDASGDDKEEIGWSTVMRNKFGAVGADDDESNEEEDGEEDGNDGGTDLSDDLNDTHNTGDAEENAVRLAQAMQANEQSGRQKVRVAVITPYEEQRSRIEEGMAARFQRLSGGDSRDVARWVRASRIVGNVDALQGQEADVVIVSPVRRPADSNPQQLGFLKDNRRLNVMLSRVQQALIIVGDVHAWLRASPASLMHSFAAYAVKHNFVYSPPEARLRAIVGGQDLLSAEPTLSVHGAPQLVMVSGEPRADLVNGVGLVPMWPSYIGEALNETVWDTPLPMEVNGAAARQTKQASSPLQSGFVFGQGAAQSSFVFGQGAAQSSFVFGQGAASMPAPVPRAAVPLRSILALPGPGARAQAVVPTPLPVRAPSSSSLWGETMLASPPFPVPAPTHMHVELTVAQFGAKVKELVKVFAAAGQAYVREAVINRAIAAVEYPAAYKRFGKDALRHLLLDCGFSLNTNSAVDLQVIVSPPAPTPAPALVRTSRLSMQEFRAIVQKCLDSLAQVGRTHVDGGEIGKLVSRDQYPEGYGRHRLLRDLLEDAGFTLLDTPSLSILVPPLLLSVGEFKSKIQQLLRESPDGFVTFSSIGSAVSRKLWPVKFQNDLRGLLELCGYSVGRTQADGGGDLRVLPSVPLTEEGGRLTRFGFQARVIALARDMEGAWKLDGGQIGQDIPRFLWPEGYASLRVLLQECGYTVCGGRGGPLYIELPL